MKIYFIPLLILIFLKSHSQNRITYNAHINFTSIISDEMYEEALNKRIKSDRVFVSFILRNSCSITDFKNEKEGVLESFNKSVIKNSKKIIIKLESCFCIDKINKESIKFYFPIQFRID
ncbi:MULTISPECIES: hypothetical protein [Flavobacterium]|uniref:TonB C-terminal domain-containing protein n=1 Tax=Flavobacterium jumunjinense TaxID=998845 RepID=A0ABV5GSZ0_9FLAO|nr:MULTISPECIES: hypothetical protein [Flavobacterium]